MRHPEASEPATEWLSIRVTPKMRTFIEGQRNGRTLSRYMRDLVRAEALRQQRHEQRTG